MGGAADIALAPFTGGLSLVPRASKMLGKALKPPGISSVGVPDIPEGPARGSTTDAAARGRAVAAAEKAPGSATSVLTETADPTGRKRRLLLGE